MKPPHPRRRRRRRSRLLSFLLCSISSRRPNANNPAAFSPPRKSVLEYDDAGDVVVDDNESISNATIKITKMDERRRRRSFRDSVETEPVWSSIGSLASRLQNTPSPVCSTCSPVGSLVSDSSGSGIHCNFSTPRNQSPSKVSVSSVDIDDWIRDGRKQSSSLYLPILLSITCVPSRVVFCVVTEVGFFLETEGDEGKTWMSCSSVYESAIGGTDQVTLASIHEEEMNEHDEEESPFLPYHKLLSRPKPYHEFLNEVEKQEVESKVYAWDQALQNDNIEKYAHYYYYCFLPCTGDPPEISSCGRWRKREAAIREWEMKQTRKAARELEELESKQKKEMAKAVEKLQQKMTRIQSKAAEKKAKGRLSSDEANI
ncbi:hypothetical protein QQ045_006871 [Rhodiola kirilowii]